LQGIIKKTMVIKGDEITVTYEKKGRKLIASKIECKRD